ncbi:MAG: hypothetical protein L6R48_11090 [Planctomycetes bacterium]|nr:hypothetical protein [Planctomycetota bacterium]
MSRANKRKIGDRHARTRLHPGRNADRHGHRGGARRPAAAGAERGQDQRPRPGLRQGAYQDADPGDHANSNRWHIALLRGGHLGETINANYLSAKITGRGNPLFRCQTLKPKLLTWNHYAVSRYFSNWDRGIAGSTGLNAVVQPDEVVYLSEFNAADYTAGTGEWRGMWPGALANFSAGGWGRATIGFNHGKAANVLMVSGRVDRLGAARLVPASLSTATPMDAGGARWHPFLAP